jgi:hypothetical protein
VKLDMLDATMMVLLSLLAAPPDAAHSAERLRAAEVEVVSGGVGEDELAALAAREKEFNLKLVFSLVQGNYLADVNVTVSDARGARVIERTGDGPFVLARLPAGEYSVTATHRDSTVTRKFRIAAGRLRTEHLRWPSNPQEDLPVSRWLEREK